MFDYLKKGITNALHSIKGYGKITESNISTTIKDIRRILVQADVNYRLAKELTDKIKEESIGTKVISSLNPQQLFSKIVYDNFVEILSCGDHTIKFAQGGKPTLILLLGLQGAGKTTFSAKLAKYIKLENKKKPLLVACDIYRPAAADQLEVLAKQNNLDFYKDDEFKDVNKIITNSIKKANENKNDVLIIDTAGRQSIDTKMMNELKNIVKNFDVTESLLVLDGIIGQISVDVAKEFNNAVDLTGVVLTKMDGDSNGGVALSIAATIGKPIKFISVGEKIDQIETFYPNRIVNRILGKGDILTLIEKTDRVLSEEDDFSQYSTSKFSFDDMILCLDKVDKIGGVSNLACFLPDTVNVNENMIKNSSELVNNAKIIYKSMTPNERKCYSRLCLSRKMRIAKGSGKTVEDINKVLKLYDRIEKTLKYVSNRNYNEVLCGKKK